jgi:ATPase subunit of ABC transporter with duplicated ATPase domains
MAEIERLRIVDRTVDERLKALNKQGEGSLMAQMIDTDFLKQTILEASNDLRRKASQRITALGQMGCGKSTTLNMMLCSSVLDMDGYRRAWSNAFPCGIQEMAPDILTLKYFADSVRAQSIHISKRYG